MTPKALLALLALGVTWGASFLFIKVIVDETSSLEVAEGRMFFGALAVGAVMGIRKTPLRWRRSLWLKVAVWALVGIVVPFTLIAWAEEHIASGTASVLNSTMPLFTAMFAAAFLIEERLTAARVAGLGVGFLGVIVLTGGEVYDLRDSTVLGQLTTDGHKPYLFAVDAACGGGVDYAMLQKLYGKAGDPENPETRYSPAVCTGTKIEKVLGDPDPKHISTSYVERQNLTMRMSMRRFTRLTNAFSKKVYNHSAAVALYFMHYNFCRVHQTIKTTPAVASGIADHEWTVEEIVGLLDSN